MARLWLAGLIAVLALSDAVAQEPNTALRVAGVCARCHVNAVLEWEMSGHARTGNSCSSCHGASKAHVADERNNVRPDRIPRGAAVASLCLNCHAAGCPKTPSKDACQTCHHVHALVDVRKPVMIEEAKIDSAAAAFQRAMETGEGAAGRQEWRSAVVAFRQAAQLRADPRAIQRLIFALRMLSPDLPGFRPITSETHPELGLPLEVEVIGTKMRMILVPGGDVDLGEDADVDFRPAHTVQVLPFYVSPDLEPRAYSWRDAMARVSQLSVAVPGGGFRLPSEPELMLALSDSRVRHRAAEWCSSLFWPYPYDAKDGREDPHASGPRLFVKFKRRQAAKPSSRAAFRFVRSVPALNVSSGERTP